MAFPWQKDVLMIYLGGVEMEWPAESLVLMDGRWKVVHIEWLTRGVENPIAPEVFQPFDRLDEAALVPIWRLKIEVVLEPGVDDLTDWKQIGEITKQQEISVGWILRKVSELQFTLEPLGGSFYEMFINFDQNGQANENNNNDNNNDSDDYNSQDQNAQANENHNEG